MTTLHQVLNLDDRLAAHGVPPLGAWWREVLARSYGHASALTLGVCAGRGSAKSTAIYKIATAETLFGEWVIPPGERHWASLTSRHRDEAAKGTAIISQWLTLLGVRHDPTDGVIELRDMPRGIRITAASVAGNTGWRSFFDGADEVGKWATDGAMAVDAAEVLASKRAMTATHPTARHMVVSTPFVDSGPFFELIHAGSNDHTLVVTAPTWVATDGRISEAQTQKLEPSERIHAREYGASFAAEWEHGYFAGLIERATQSWTSLSHQQGHRYVAAIDPAFGRDLFAICIAHAEPGGAVIVDRIEALTPPRGGSSLSPTDCIRATRQIQEAYGCGEVLSDQFSSATLVDLAAREGMALHPIPWTSTSKAERYEVVRNLMRDAKLQIPSDKPLLRELSGIGTRLLPSGAESIQGRSGYTDDRVSALVLAASEAAANVPSGIPYKPFDARGTGSRWSDPTPDAFKAPRGRGYGSDRGF